jgi:hypothetical protein
MGNSGWLHMSSSWWIIVDTDLYLRNRVMRQSLIQALWGLSTQPLTGKPSKLGDALHGHRQCIQDCRRTRRWVLSNPTRKLYCVVSIVWYCGAGRCSAKGLRFESSFVLLLDPFSSFCVRGSKLSSWYVSIHVLCLETKLRLSSYRYENHTWKMSKHIKFALCSDMGDSSFPLEPLHESMNVLFMTSIFSQRPENIVQLLHHRASVMNYTKYMQHWKFSFNSLVLGVGF